MRHKYATPAIVLGRASLSEASALVSLLTPELGLVRARAQSVRKPGAKMASALQTFAESDVILLRGKEGWRLAGAILTHSWFTDLSVSARATAGRVAGLLLRLLHGEIADAVFYYLFMDFIRALPTLSEELLDAAECVVALRILHAVGVNAGEIPGGVEGNYAPEILKDVTEHRTEYVVRINKGIEASGL